jgi:hypothetical protein
MHLLVTLEMFVKPITWQMHGDPGLPAQRARLRPGHVAGRGRPGPLPRGQGRAQPGHRRQRRDAGRLSGIPGALAHGRLGLAGPAVTP